MLSHSSCTLGQFDALYVDCFGWQIAPGGGGWSSRPETVLFRDAQLEDEGQDEPGVALQDLEADI
jgi:hypothetical protein